MTLSSMTGFARGHGVSGPYAFAWELKSVNSKQGTRSSSFWLPPGWDAVEAPVRARAAQALSRGSVFANLAVTREGVESTVRCVNEPVLAAVLATIKSLSGKVDAAPATLDGILSLKGVIEVIDAEEKEDDRRAAESCDRPGLPRPGAEGPRRDARATKATRSAAFLQWTCSTEIAALAARAEATPGRKAEAIRARLTAQIAELMDASGKRLDSDRLHQEAILMAAKADIREELDRLVAHVAQARKLLADGGPAGRKLDFLSQELNRESNTLCAKANDVELTNTGLELKAVVEQFREQVQNLE